MGSHKLGFARLLLQAALVFAAQSVSAQQGARTIGDWRLSCTPTLDELRAPPCDIAQVVRRRGESEAILRVSVAYAPQLRAYGLHLSAPDNIDPDARIVIGIDNGSIITAIPVIDCSVEACYAEKIVTESKMQPLLAASNAFAILTTQSGSSYSVPISLNGFRAAAKALVSPDVDSYEGPQPGDSLHAPDAIARASGSGDAAVSRSASSGVAAVTLAAAKAAPIGVSPRDDAPSIVASAAGARNMVQLAAFGTREAAELERKRISRVFEDLLAGGVAEISYANLGKSGVYYRLRVGPYETAALASTVCRDLESRGQSCFVTSK